MPFQWGAPDVILLFLAVAIPALRERDPNAP